MQNRVVLLLCLIALCNSMEMLSVQMHDYINSVQSEWKAGVNFGEGDMERVKRLCGTYLENAPVELEIVDYNLQLQVSALPDNFDSRVEWSGCESIKEIRDQSNCGSCWAFGAVEAMSDRICIKSNQQKQLRVSSNDLVACCGMLKGCGQGCSGGFPSGAWSYWKSSGIPTGSVFNDTQFCQSYVMPPCAHHVLSDKYQQCSAFPEYSTPKCTKKCTDASKVYSSSLTFGSSAYSAKGEANIMQEIYNNGPVEGAFTVYADFPNYKSGVYSHVTGGQLGGHAIKIIGWGVENNVKYWLCVNSWNETWGDQGLFKIKRGNNECGIENAVYAGLPKL